MMKMAVEHLGRRMVSHANQNSVASSYLGPAGKCPVGHTAVRYIPSLLPSFFFRWSQQFLSFSPSRPEINEALTTRSPQKQNVKNKLQSFIHLLFTYSCLCLLHT